MENFFLSQRQSVETNEKTQFITKYKPYYIDDFKGNEQLISVIKSLIKIDDLNILVTGSGNSGKTSLLYAIIREYYGLSKEDNLPENNIMHINEMQGKTRVYIKSGNVINIKGTI